MATEKPLKIMLTFKQNEKWLFDEVQKHSGKGNWIKDVLTEHLSKEQQSTCSPMDELY